MAEDVGGLLPCPFCGRSDLEIKTDPMVGFPAVNCLGCGAVGPLSRSDQKREAAANWNRKAASRGLRPWWGGGRRIPAAGPIVISFPHEGDIGVQPVPLYGQASDVQVGTVRLVDGEAHCTFTDPDFGGAMHYLALASVRQSALIVVAKGGGDRVVLVTRAAKPRVIDDAADMNLGDGEHVTCGPCDIVPLRTP